MESTATKGSPAPSDRFNFSPEFLDKLNSLRALVESSGNNGGHEDILDKRRNNVASYLTAHRWRQLAEDDQTPEKFKELFEIIYKNLLNIGKMGRAKRKEVDEKYKDLKEEERTQLEIDIQLQEVQLIKKYIVSYFRYYGARFAYNEPKNVLDMPEIKPWFQSNPALPTNPNTTYKQADFSNFSKTVDWLSNSQVDELVDYLKECYASYDVTDIAVTTIKSIIYYVLYLDMYQNLSGKYLVGSNYNLEKYEQDDPEIFNFSMNFTKAQITTFVNTKLSSTTNAPIMADYFNRMLAMVDNNKALIYLTDTELTDLNVQKMASRKNRFKITALTREWARLRVPGALFGGDDEEAPGPTQDTSDVVFMQGDEALASIPNNYQGEDEDMVEDEAMAQGQ